MLAVLFITGFCSMGMEVVWVRAFTPVIGTLVIDSTPAQIKASPAFIWMEPAAI